MRKLFAVVNNGLGDVLVNDLIRLRPSETLKIIERFRPRVHGIGAWTVDCAITVERGMVEDWEKGWTITKSKECKRV